MICQLADAGSYLGSSDRDGTCCTLDIVKWTLQGLSTIKDAQGFLAITRLFKSLKFQARATPLAKMPGYHLGLLGKPGYS